MAPFSKYNYTEVLIQRALDVALDRCNTTTTNNTHEITTSCGPEGEGFWISTGTKPLILSKKVSGGLTFAFILLVVFVTMLLASLLKQVAESVKGCLEERKKRRAAKSRERIARQQDRVQQIQDDWRSGNVLQPQTQPSTWIKRKISRVISWSSTATATSSNQVQPQSYLLSTRNTSTPSNPPPTYSHATGVYSLESDDHLPTYYDESGRPRSPPPIYIAPGHDSVLLNPEDLDRILGMEEAWEFSSRRQRPHEGHNQGNTDVRHTITAIAGTTDENDESEWEDYEESELEDVDPERIRGEVEEMRMELESRSQWAEHARNTHGNHSAERRAGRVFDGDNNGGTMSRNHHLMSITSIVVDRIMRSPPTTPRLLYPNSQDYRDFVSERDAQRGMGSGAGPSNREAGGNVSSISSTVAANSPATNAGEQLELSWYTETGSYFRNASIDVESFVEFYGEDSNVFPELREVIESGSPILGAEEYILLSLDLVPGLYARRSPFQEGRYQRRLRFIKHSEDIPEGLRWVQTDLIQVVGGMCTCR